MRPVEVSVVIPLYNKSATIERALTSVCRQTLQPKEIIVIDDGSTDESFSIAERFKLNHPELNLRVLFQTNQGVSAARNNAIQAASTEFVALLDADDTYDPGFVEEVTNLLQRYPDAEVACTRYRFIYADQTSRDARWTKMTGRPSQGRLKNYFGMVATGELPLSASSICFSKSAFERVGGFPLGQQMGEDQWVWSLLALKEQIVYSKTPFANYYADVSDSLMKTQTPVAELPYSRMLQDLIDTGSLSGLQSRDVRAMIRTHLLDLVRRSLASNQLDTCSRLMQDRRLKVFRLKPIYWRLKCAFVRIGAQRGLDLSA